MIQKIKLSNWRSHLDSELNFSNGTNVLLGILGSGKSSVLDAVCFALFGTFPNLQSKKIKLDDLLMKKPVEKTRSEIEVSFLANGNNYSVKRIVEKGKGTIYSEIKENGKLLEYPSTSRVTELIEKNLKINYDLFSKAVYSEQNSIDYFLTIPKGQRMKRIDELLMIDKFEKARSSTNSLLNRLTERKLAKQSIVEQINAIELEKILVELKNSIERMWKEKVNMEKEFHEISIQRENQEKNLREMQNLRENLETFRRDESAVNSALRESLISFEGLEKSLKDVDKLSIEKNLKEFIRYIDILEETLIDRMKKYDKIQIQTSKSKAEIEFLKKEKLENLEMELKEKLQVKKQLESYKKKYGKNLEDELDDKKTVLEKYVGEIELLKIKITDLKDTIEQLSSLGGKCPICESKLTKEKKIILIKQKQFQVSSLKDNLKKSLKKKELTEKELYELEGAANKLDEMLDVIKDLDKIQSEYENSKNIFIVLSESSDKLSQELEELKKELGDLQVKIKDSTEKKQKFEIKSMQLRDYEEKRGRIEFFIRKRNEIEHHLKNFQQEIVGKDFNKMETELRRSIAGEKEAEMRIQSIGQLVKEKEIRTKDIEQSINTVTKEKSDIEKLDKMIQQLRLFGKAVEQTQIELRKEFIISVNFTMESLWEDLYPYQDFINARLSVEDNDYNLQLQERSGNWVNVEGYASGGERSIAALTLRIAFSLVLAPQLKWLVLDEPTANLDTKAVEDLSTTLSEKINTFIDQVFIITHDERLENAVTGNSYKLERDKSKDGTTIVKILS